MVDNVVAEHVEVTLIIVCRAYHAVAVQGDVVAAGLVHQKLQRGVLVAVDEEVHVHVGLHLAIRLTAFVTASVLLPGVTVRPVYEAVQDPVGRGGVVDKHRPLVRHGIDVEGQDAGAAGDVTRAGGVYRAVEDILAEGVGVHGQQVMGVDAYVVSEVVQVLVAQVGRGDADMPVPVRDRVIEELHVVRYELHRLTLHMVGGVQGGYGEVSGCHGVPHDLYLLQRAHDVDVAPPLHVEVMGEGVTVVAHEVQARADGRHAQVDAVVLRGDISLYHGVVVLILGGHAVEVDVSVVDVPGHGGVERAERPSLEVEVLHLKVVRADVR